MQIRYEFRKVTTPLRHKAGTPTTQPLHDGTVVVVLSINKNRYGPYSTGIRTLRTIWDGRKAKRVGPDSRALANELSDHQTNLEAAHAELLRRGELIDGQSIMNLAKGPVQTGNALPVSQLYNEFMAAKQASLETDRRKRKDDQISTETLRTYPKRWVMIQLYLAHIKRTELPIGAITFSFVTNLKEYLTSQKLNKGGYYSSSTVNKCISMLKMLVTYAQSKGYVRENPISTFACRGGSAANPKPLPEVMLSHLETCDLPGKLRHICDSWLIAGELCLHYSDYMQLPSMKFITHTDGRLYIQHERSKQQGTSLKQTVNVTPRAARLLEKWGGPSGLYYRKSAQFSDELKKIALLADIRDSDGNLIALQFGQGRDSGLTSRARKGANGIQLTSMAGWSNPREARRYLGDALGIVAGFVERQSPDSTDTESGTH